MKVAKRMFVIVVALGFLTMSCEGGSNGAKVLRINTWDTDLVVVYLEQIASDFMKLHPDIKIQVESVPQGFEQSILVQLAGGSAPDVFQVSDSLLSNFHAMGALMDITPFINGDNPLNLDDFYESILDIGKIGDGMFVLPADFTTQVVYYNKDIFDEAGIAYPAEDWTWEDFRQIAKRLTIYDATNNPERFGAVLPLAYGSRGALPFIYAFGGDLISPDGSTVLGYTNSDATIAAMQWLSDLTHVDKVVPSAIQTGAMQGIDLFLSGLAAMSITGSWPASGYVDAGLNFGTATLPKGPAGQYGTSHYAGYGISKDTKYLEEAWLFLRYLATEGRYIFSQRAMVAYIPAVFAAGQDAIPHMQAFFKMTEFAKPFPELLNPEWRTTAGRLFEEVAGEIQLGTATDIRVLLDEAAEKGQAEMEEKMGLR